MYVFPDRKHLQVLVPLLPFYDSCDSDIVSARAQNPCRMGMRTIKMTKRKKKLLKLHSQTMKVLQHNSC